VKGPSGERPARRERFVGDFDLLAAVVLLGAEFRKRNMDAHLAALRRFYEEQRRRKRARALTMARDRVWDEDMVIEWLGLLRIPPFEHMYPLLPRDAPCPTCGATSSRELPATFVRLVWPGGSLEQCRRCETSWIQDHAEGACLSPPDALAGSEDDGRG
jgi:hypothetical protein